MNATVDPDSPIGQEARAWALAVFGEPFPPERSAALRKAFAALTPGRQRGYLLHFGGAKRSETRNRCPAVAAVITPFVLTRSQASAKESMEPSAETSARGRQALSSWLMA